MTSNQYGGGGVGVVVGGGDRGAGGGVGGGVGVKMSVVVFPPGSVCAGQASPLRGRCCLTTPLAASTHALSNFHFVSPGRPTLR